jgi:hypothetical protein
MIDKPKKIIKVLLPYGFSLREKQRVILIKIFDEIADERGFVFEVEFSNEPE